jgi:hypothetical protein
VRAREPGALFFREPRSPDTFIALTGVARPGIVRGRNMFFSRNRTRRFFSILLLWLGGVPDNDDPLI